MRRRASQRPRALPLIGDSCLPRPRLPCPLRTICLLCMRHSGAFVWAQQRDRPHLRRDRPHVCAATAGLRDGVLRRLAGQRAHPARICAGLGARPPEATLQRTRRLAHAHTRARTNARATRQRRVPRRVHSARAIRRTGPVRYSRRAEVLKVRYSEHLRTRSTHSRRCASTPSGSRARFRPPRRPTRTPRRRARRTRPRGSPS